MIRETFCAVFYIFAFINSFDVIEGQRSLNPTCRAPRSGLCVDIWKCPFYVNLLHMNPRPRYLIITMKKNLCGFVNSQTPKVCCPLEFNQDQVERDEIGTHENFHLLPVDICGLISHGTRIVEGASASPREFPWMALIAYKTGDSPDDQDFKCGGSLINKRYVLTAAHCLDDKSVLGIRLGEYDISLEVECYKTDDNCESPVQDILIDKITIHSKYNPTTYANDIGLVRLTTPARFLQENIKPICLPHGKLQQTNLLRKFLTVTGWGTTETGHKSMVLQKVSIPVVPLKECRKLYGKFAAVTKNQICAGGYKGRDSCSGDSGGPLQYIAQMGSSQRYVQDGIVSYGSKQCGIDGRPAIYTNVKEYMSWILDNIEP